MQKVDHQLLKKIPLANQQVFQVNQLILGYQLDTFLYSFSFPTAKKVESTPDLWQFLRGKYFFVIHYYPNPFSWLNPY